MRYPSATQSKTGEVLTRPVRLPHCFAPLLGSTAHRSNLFPIPLVSTLGPHGAPTGLERRCRCTGENAESEPLVAFVVGARHSDAGQSDR